MKNPSLGRDYIVRARKRLAAVDALYGEEAWPDVVRESQEVVELALKGLLRTAQIDAPRIHDVGTILREHSERLSPPVRKEIHKLSDISRRLRRDRELAFYGSEDLVPSEFYREKDAADARRDARWVVGIVEAELKRRK